MKLLQLTFAILVLSSVGFSANAKLVLNCAISDADAAGAIYLAYAFASGGQTQVTGDIAYDNELSAYVEANFSEDDADLVANEMSNNSKVHDAIQKKGDSLWQQGIKGRPWMQELVSLYKNPNNGLCN